MSKDPQINATNYILNIVELQNTITSASGLTPLSALTTTVSQIQEIVDYDNKRINVNTIAKFSDTTVPISLINDLNLCNATLYSNGVPFQGGGGSGGYGADRGERSDRGGFGGGRDRDRDRDRGRNRDDY